MATTRPPFRKWISLIAARSVYWRLVRPGLLLMVLVTMAIPAWMAIPSPPVSRLVNALLGTALLIAGATATNQLIERRRDAKMARTASRPLPSGRATTRQVAAFAVFGSVAGIAYLAALQPPVLTLLAAASWGIYVLIYTPLKYTSVWHIAAGAVAGALPVLLGAAAAGAAFAPLALALFGIVFFWQFPHTAAVGWRYREQYARAEIKVAAVVDPSGRLAGWLALFGAAGLLLSSLVPAMLSPLGGLYPAIAALLGLLHLVLAARFLNRPTDAAARALWRISLVHLPVLLVLLLVTSQRPI